MEKRKRRMYDEYVVNEKIMVIKKEENKMKMQLSSYILSLACFLYVTIPKRAFAKVPNLQSQKELESI